MSADLAQLLGVGIALAGLMLALQVRTDKRLDATDKRLDALRSEVRGMDRRLARVEGLIEGAGLFRRPADAPAPGD